MAPYFPHSLKVGQFDRTAFKQSAEKQFDSTFGYKRELKETFKYVNTLKNGSYEQKLEMKEQEEKALKKLKDKNSQKEQQKQVIQQRQQHYLLKQGR